MMRMCVRDQNSLHSSKSRPLATIYKEPFSDAPLSLTGRLGSLVMVGLGGTIPEGTAMKRKSVSCIHALEMDGRGDVRRTCLDNSFERSGVM